ncbi:MAG: MBL fold metallo-hydrolase [Spirochaetota bacterium]
MVITFYGEGCFKIQSGEFSVLTDPFDAQTGLTPPRFKVDLVLRTITPVSSLEKKDDVVVSEIIGSGEYNISGADISGFQLVKESSKSFFKTAYSLKLEDINLCFLGHISEIPEPMVLERLGEPDIIFIPAGGAPFMDLKLAVKIIKQLQPKLVIPCFFKVPSLKRKAGDIKDFLEELNGNKEKIGEAVEKLVIKKKDLAEIKKTQVVVLKI